MSTTEDIHDDHLENNEEDNEVLTHRPLFESKFTFVGR